MKLLENKKVVGYARGLGELLILCGVVWGIAAWIWELLEPLFVFLGEAGRTAMDAALVVSVLLLLCQVHARRAPGITSAELRGITRAASVACLVTGTICISVGYWAVACLIVGIGLANLPGNE